MQYEMEKDSCEHKVDYYETTFRTYSGTVTTIKLSDKTVSEIIDVRRYLR